MTKKRSMSAKDFAAKLRSDSAYMAKIDAQARNAGEIEAAERELLSALATLGYSASTLTQLLEKYAPLPADLANALSEILGRIANANVQEAIVRALGATRSEFDALPLAKLYDATNVPSLRWAISNTFAEARPVQLAAWLLSHALDPKLGSAREMLLLAVARTNPPDVANPALVELLADLPGHAALGLAESGGPRELPALKQAHASAQGWEKEQIGRTIAVIERRAQERR